MNQLVAATAVNDDVLRHLAQRIVGSQRDRLSENIVLLNVIFLFLRPQHDLPFLATLQIPLLLSIPSFVVFLSRANAKWPHQLYLMCGVLLLGAITGPFALNTRYAFEGFRTLLQLFFGIVFPATLVLSTGNGLRRLRRVFAICGFCLAVYGLIKGGTGPGDFLLDENDFCSVIVVLFPFVCFPLFHRTKSFSRFGTIIAAVVGLGAIVMTKSRGGFLGFGAGILVLVFTSPRKGRSILLLFGVVLVALLIAPSAYWERMQTINQVDTGSAKERIDSWKAAFQIFSRPKNILQGVGIKNLPIHLGDYKTSEGRNLFGRQAHSLWFDILGDLGVIGFSLIVLLLFSCLCASWRIARHNYLNGITMRKGALYSEEEGGVATRSEIGSGRFEVLSALESEAYFARDFARALCASWAAAIVSSSFISVLYYPTVWMLAGISGAFSVYEGKLQLLSKTVVNADESEDVGRAR